MYICAPVLQLMGHGIVKRSLNIWIVFLGKRVRDAVLQALVSMPGNWKLRIKLALEILPLLSVKTVTIVLCFKSSLPLSKVENPLPSA